MSVSLHLHSSLIHSLIRTNTILIIIYFQNRWSHDSIVSPTYNLMGSPGHYPLKIIFLKLSFFSSHILHDICLNILFVIVIVIVNLGTIPNLHNYKRLSHLISCRIPLADQNPSKYWL